LNIKRRQAQNDESQFKTSKALARAEEKNAYVTPTAEGEKKAKEKVKKDKAKHLSLDEFTATKPDNNGSARRGGKRGGRGGRTGGSPPDVTGADFPALKTGTATPAPAATTTPAGAKK
jgi:hypothetical protein